MSSRMNMSEQKVESYLRDIPEGLFPRHVLMTDKEKKKLVVRRLEQLFTGKISGRHVRRNQTINPSNNPAQGGTLAPTVTEAASGPQRQMVHQPPNLQQPPVPQPPSLQQSTVPPPPTVPQQPGLGNEPSREARILPPEQQTGSGKKSRSRDNASTSHSGGDQTESGGNGNSSGGTNNSPTMLPPPEQRPTRLKDLDPDRIQVPSENMEYIKHLGLVPPELLNEPTEDVHPDADGWVYLNLLCNLAQLHMINVTPDFVRAAVSDISTRIQLSPDGRKIRWRGGTEGTQLSSDSSGDGGQNSMEIDTDSSNKDERRKRQKMGHSTGDEFSGSSSKNPSKFGPQISASSESFHYKPLFVHQDSSNGQSSMDETLSSFGPVEDSNIDDSRWGHSGSGNSLKRKRRHDGAIIYYSGAPFYTDLSGDPGDISPTTYMMSSGQGYQDSPGQFVRPPARRSELDSLLSYRPLSDRKTSISDASTKIDVGSLDRSSDLTTDSGDDISEVELDMEWGDEQQFLEVHTLEPCGLGGVLPEDHFMVVVRTKRAKDETYPPPRHRSKTEEMTDNIIGRLASMSTSSPGPMVSISSKTAPPVVEIEYVSGRIKRLTPVQLPPPAIFFPPFSSDSSADEDCDYSEEPLDESLSGEVASRRANLHHSDDYPDGVDLTSGDEDGEDPDNEPDTHGMYDDEDSVRDKRPPALRRQSSAEAAAGTSARGRSKSASADLMGRTGSGSSAATAGGQGSVDESSGEMSS